MNQPADSPTPHDSNVALLVDYDNLYHIISTQSNGQQYPDEYASEILRELKRYLKEQANAPTAVARAYADYGTLDGDGHFVQRALQLDGIQPLFVSSILEENASELQLYLEAAEVLQQRDDLTQVVIVTGDHSHLPLVQHIQKQGREPLVVSVQPPSEDDIPPFAQGDVYMNALNLLSEETRSDFRTGDATADTEDPPIPEFQSVEASAARRTIAITEEHFGQYDEVYLTPLLRKLSDILGPDHDPKSLISALEEAGAVRLEKRNGYPYDYTVLIVHEDHPDVEEIHADFHSASSYDGDVDAAYDGSADATYESYEDYYADDGEAVETADDPHPDADALHSNPGTSNADEDTGYDASDQRGASGDDTRTNDETW